MNQSCKFLLSGAVSRARLLQALTDTAVSRALNLASGESFVFKTKGYIYAEHSPTRRIACSYV